MVADQSGALKTRRRVKSTGHRTDEEALRSDREPGARFTKYLTTILRLSYNNAEVTIDLRQTSNVQNIIQ